MQKTTGYTLDDFKIGDIVKSASNTIPDFKVIAFSVNRKYLWIENAYGQQGQQFKISPGSVYPASGPQTKPKPPVVDFEYNNKEAIYKEMLLNGTKNIEMSAVGNSINGGWLSCQYLLKDVNQVIEEFERVPQNLNIRIRPQPKQVESKTTTEFVLGSKYEFEVQFTENPDGSVHADVLDVWQKGAFDSCFAGNKYKE